MKKAGYILASIIATSSALAEERPEQATARMLESPNGRYVFGQISGMRRDQYMLDTLTGRLWVVVQTKEGSTVLQPVLFAALSGQDSVTPDDPSAVEHFNAYLARAEEHKKEFDPDDFLRKSATPTPTNPYSQFITTPTPANPFDQFDKK